MRNATMRISRSSWAVSSDPHAAPSPAADWANSCSIFGGSSLMPHIFSLKCARGGERDRKLFNGRRVQTFDHVTRLELGILPRQGRSCGSSRMGNRAASTCVVCRKRIVDWQIIRRQVERRAVGRFGDRRHLARSWERRFGDLVDVAATIFFGEQRVARFARRFHRAAAPELLLIRVVEIIVVLVLAVMKMNDVVVLEADEILMGLVVVRSVRESLWVFVPVAEELPRMVVGGRNWCGSDQSSQQRERGNNLQQKQSHDSISRMKWEKRGG